VTNTSRAKQSTIGSTMPTGGDPSKLRGLDSSKISRIIDDPSFRNRLRDEDSLFQHSNGRHLNQSPRLTTQRHTDLSYIEPSARTMASSTLSNSKHPFAKRAMVKPHSLQNSRHQSPKLPVFESKPRVPGRFNELSLQYLTKIQSIIERNLPKKKDEIIET